MEHGEWVRKLVAYEGADIFKSVQQLITSFVPYFILMYTMSLLISNGHIYWFVLALAPVASLFMVRIFLIMHDCSNKSYWRRSSLVSFIIGHICGVFTFMSFFHFREGHVIHHATVANLDKRGDGDVWTMTVNEYRASPLWKKIVYRVFRNPFFLFGIAPAVKFLLINRLPTSTKRVKTILSIIFTDIMIGLIIFLAYKTVGIRQYLAIQVPVAIPGLSLGV
jgi:omega-6 fatty acid desaturase (delta-12 desaturase)